MFVAKNQNFVPTRRRCVLTIAHVDYLHDRSGTPKAILSQKKAFSDYNIDYIGIVSIQDSVRNHRIPSVSCMLIINDTIVAIRSFDCILAAFESWKREGLQIIGIHIHHCRYLNVQFAEALIDLFQDAPVKIMLHDYYLCCTGTNLLRNGEAYCHSTRLGGEQCLHCDVYHRSLPRERLLWQMIAPRINRVSFIAPSQIAMSIFLRFHPEIQHDIQEKCLVLPHQEKEGYYKENLRQISDNEKLRVAYIGSASTIKGWSLWTNLVDSYPDDYEYYVFNGNGVVHKNERNVEVNFTNQDLNAMTIALRKYSPHIAVIASIWPETYSYTYYEAISANCFIVTHKDSGNIAWQVNENGNGVVLSGSQGMLAFFSCPDRVRDRVNAYRLSSPGGPLNLRDNEDLVRLTLDEVSGVTSDGQSPELLKLSVPAERNPLALLIERVFTWVRHYKYDSNGNLVAGS